MKKFYTYGFVILPVLFLLFVTNELHAQTPKRIISLAPSLTKNLYLLDAGDLIVGCTSYCTVQSETKATVVASAIQVNYEKAALLNPDLIITTTLTKQKTIETFKKLGIEVLVFENPRSFEEICDQFIALGEKVGKKQKAVQIITNAKKRIEAIKKKVPADAEPQKIFMQLGANPLFAVVPNEFMNDYIIYSGTDNIARDLKIGSINKETVFLRNPDIIVVVLMGTLGKEEKEHWLKYQHLSAVKKKQVFVLDADQACSPTPLSFVDTLENLINMIYESN